MKSINFTFLVAFSFLFLFSREISANCLAECPNFSDIACWKNCKARTAAPVDQKKISSPSSSPGKVSSVSKKNPKTKESNGDAGSKASSDSNEAKSAKCEPRTYPRGRACIPCPEGQSVDGGYCNSEPDLNSDNKKISCEQNEKLYCPETEGKCECIKELADSPSPEENANPAAAQCMSEFGRLVQECNKEAENAMTSCNDENEAMQAAANAAKTIGAGAVASIQVACSKINEISKLANEAFAGWHSLCSANQGGCQENCKKAREILNSDCMDSATKEEMRVEHSSKINKNIVQCESYKQKLFDAAQHAVAAIAQTKASEQCKEDTTADLNKNAILDQCKINPNTPMCTDMEKCSNPAFAAQNPVCSCVSNPTSPACLQASANYGNKGLSMGATIPGVKNEKGENLPGMSPNGSADANPFPGFNNGGGHSDGPSVGGRQGDASSAGSGKMGADNGAGNGKGGYGSGNEKDGLRVNSGTYGGGGSGYFGPNYGGAGGGRALGGANNPTGARRDIAKFDPRKYIVGQGGQGEYLNGPNGNIFKIMKRRYEENRSTFFPETFILKK